MSNSTLYVFIILFSAVTNVYSGKHKPKFSDEIKEIIQHIHNECVGKTGVAEGNGPVAKPLANLTNQEAVEIDILNSIIEDIQNCENGIFKDDPKLKCYMFCLLEEASLVDDDGIVDYDMMISLIPEDYYDRVSKMIFTCKYLDTLDKDKCQRAFDVHKCSYEKDPDLYFLF